MKFITKNEGYNNSNDVGVKFFKRKYKDEELITFVCRLDFRYVMESKHTINIQPGDYLCFALENDKLFIKKTTKTKGWKVGENGSVTFSRKDDGRNDDFKEILEWARKYSDLMLPLNYDKEYELYYIQKEDLKFINK